MLWTFGRLSSCAGVLKISKLLNKSCLSISIGCHGPGSTVYPVQCFHSFSLLLSVIRRRQARALGPALLVPELCLLSSRLFLSFLMFSLFPFQCLLLFPAFEVIFVLPLLPCVSTEFCLSLSFFLAYKLTSLTSFSIFYLFLINSPRLTLKLGFLFIVGPQLVGSPIILGSSSCLLSQWEVNKEVLVVTFRRCYI